MQAYTVRKKKDKKTFVLTRDEEEKQTEDRGRFTDT